MAMTDKYTAKAAVRRSNLLVNLWQLLSLAVVSIINTLQLKAAIQFKNTCFAINWGDYCKLSIMSLLFACN